MRRSPDDQQLWDRWLLIALVTPIDHDELDLGVLATLIERQVGTLARAGADDIVNVMREYAIEGARWGPMQRRQVPDVRRCAQR